MADDLNARCDSCLRLSRAQGGLPKDSVVNVSQQITIDRSMLTGRVKKLPSRQIAAIDEGLRLVLSLGC